MRKFAASLAGSLCVALGGESSSMDDPVRIQRQRRVEMSWRRFDRIGQAWTVGIFLLLASVAYARTPPRLVQIECPICQTKHWEIDADFRGEPLAGLPAKVYVEREYRCYKCLYHGTGYHVIQKSPPEFLLQPHPMYPMTQADFDHWVAILRENFPDHPQLKELGKGFRPNIVFPSSLRNEVQ
jgi:hypothetical protein